MASDTETRQGIAITDLLEAGLHFGHQTKRWNPKMKRYIFDKRNGIHIVDLAKSLVMLQNALQFVHEVVLRGENILFVGTKKQAQSVIKEVAEDCGQFYVTNRWLGGTMTNSGTIRRGVKRMREIQEFEKTEEFSAHKKEASRLRRELDRLTNNLGGIADMEKLPGALFVVDINREAIAVAEAAKLDIPVIAIVDTNCDPDPIEYVIPGNDDAIRAIRLVATAVGDMVKQATEEYAKAAAEAARKKEKEEAAAEAERKKAEAEKQKAKKREKEKAGEKKTAGAGTGKTKASEKSPKQASKSKTKTEAPAVEGKPKPKMKAAEKKEDAPASQPAEKSAKVKQKTEKKKTASAAKAE